MNVIGRAADRVGLIDLQYDLSDRPIITPVEPSAHDIRLADMLARQIEIEQTLTANRMAWNLTFQGFMIAGFALVATADGSAPARSVVQFLIAAVSLVVSYATIRGIVASQRQRTYLRRYWMANRLSNSFPEPFSASAGSKLGRTQPLWICWALMAMWIVLIPAGFLLTDIQKPKHIIVETAGGER